MDFSIIIRLINRSDLKGILKNILGELAGYSKGEYELVVLDLFEENENEIGSYGEMAALEEDSKYDAVGNGAVSMQDCIQVCKKYGARYFNKSVSFNILKYEHIVFFDSDTQFCSELKINGNTLIGKYSKQYENLKEDNICGLLGATVLTGKRSLRWRALEYSRLYRDYYTQHTYLAYANFSPPSNVSYLKSAIEKANLLDKNLPKTYYDHMDFSYSLIESGCKIKCVSDIVLYKQREVFNKTNRLNDFLKANAIADYRFGKKHDKTLIKPLPSLILLSFIVLIATGLLTGITLAVASSSHHIVRAFIPIILGVAFCIVSILSAFLIDTKKSRHKNFIFFIFGRFLDFRLYMHRQIYKRKQKDKSHKRVIIYNAAHAKAKFALQAKKLKIAVFNLVILTLIFLILLRTSGVF